MPPTRLLPVLPQPAPHRPSLDEDLLRGSEAIVKHLNLASPRQLYNMIAKGKKRGFPPPIFNDGTGLCARKSGLKDWYERLEQGVLAVSR